MSNSARRVVYAAQARAHLLSIESYIATQATPAIAERFINAIIAKCNPLEHSPYLGTPHDDWRPGLRTITYKRAATIGYVVEGDRVVIIGVAYRGRDLASFFAQQPVH